ncbi:MAG: Hsp20/alpha crystallin family protein [Nitrospirales bacterium]|nr:Hsp20/alpha crystallin family protein [Nitrospirales bacterium]
MLVKWDPYTEFDKAIDGLFRRPLALRPVWDDRNGETTAWRPAVNVYEDKDHLAIEAQLPGVGMEDVTLSVTDRTLQLRGERKHEHEKQAEGYHIREAEYGAFSRSFSLPAYVDPNLAKASFSNGVLTIQIPKQEKAKVRNIQIESK